MEPVPELWQRVTVLIREIFPAAEVPRIRELVRDFHWTLGPAFDDRSHLDILGNLCWQCPKGSRTGGTGKVDWLDLIMAAECEVKEGKMAQNKGSKIRLMELRVEKMRRVADGE
jgi:hypothetical protein